jgi:hypothetical protein
MRNADAFATAVAARKNTVVAGSCPIAHMPPAKRTIPNKNRPGGPSTKRVHADGRGESMWSMDSWAMAA